MRQKKDLFTYHCRHAINVLKTAIKQNDKRITNPELFSPLQPEPKSSLIWKRHKTELYELLVALHETGVIRTATSDPAEFAVIVREFSRVFNIKLGDPRDIKRDISMRKIKQTAFLKELEEAILKIVITAQ